MIGENQALRIENRAVSAAFRLWALGSLFLLLSACAQPFGTAAGPQPTPTPPLAPYNAAIATAVAGGDARKQAAAYYERGNVQLDAGANAEALADYDNAIALDPSNARVFNNRALAYVALGQLDQALADYAAAIKLDPGYIRAYENRLRLLEQRGDLKGMAADYHQLAALDPKNAARYRYREGSALHGLRDFVGARHAYDAALAADPQQVDALYERGLLSFAQGNPTAAIADLDAALRLSPRAANGYYARGLAYDASGDHTAAIADFTKALALKPDYPEALLGRATAHHMVNQDALARADVAAIKEKTLDDTLKAALGVLRQQIGMAEQQR
ncbi:MAG TPA: tetratricopeptide repeat protein [Roseiflexaceae bacterium]|nr:tetratricopeptide repeat protein [Roseiflexaceae bacterium]